MMNANEILALLAGEEKSEKRNFWISLLQSGISITEPLLDEGNAKVAIYEPEKDTGYAEIFINELLRCEVVIDSIITDEPAGKEMGEKYGIECVNLGGLSVRKSIDFVVIVSSENYRRLRLKILNETSAEVISLKGLIELVLYSRILIRFVLGTAQYCINSCVLGWPMVSDFNDEELFNIAEKINFSFTEYRGNPERFKSLYGDLREYSDDYIKEIFQERNVIQIGNRHVSADYTGRFYNIINSRRLTVGQPNEAEYGIYVMGGCTAFGLGTDDRHTLSSLLQKKINEYYGSVKNSKCSVYDLSVRDTRINLAQDFIRSDEKKKKLVIDVFRADLEYPKGGEGRIYRYFRKCLKEKDIEYIDLTSTLYDVEKRVGTYFDMTHINHRGYKAIAEKVWNDFLKPIFESGELSDDNETINGLTLSGKWKMLHGVGHSVSEFFTHSNAKNVGVYFSGEKRDKLFDFIDTFVQTGVKVTIIVEDDGIQDENLVFPDIKHLKLSDITADDKLDIVLLSTVENIAETKSRIKGLLKTEVIPLNDVIELMWDKYFFYPKISEKFEDSGAYLCICFWPGISDLNLPASIEQSRAAEGLSEEMLDRNFTYLGANLYNEITVFSKEYLKEVTESRLDNSDGIKAKNADRKGSAVNVEHGVRRTASQPKGAKRRVHVFGGGAAFGIGAEDKYTLPSFLQEQMNLHSKNFNTEPILVENEGVCLYSVSNINILDEKIAQKLRKGNIADGDIVIWLIDKRYSITETDKKSFAYLTACLGHDIQAVDLTQTMRLAQKKLAYIDRKHVNHRGYKIASTKLYMDYVKRVIDSNFAHKK